MASYIDNDREFVENRNVNVMDTDITEKKIELNDADVNEIDKFESICSHYIKESIEYQFFECVCVILIIFLKTM